MGRFLTPSKITLLVLAQIYCKGSVPFSGTAHVLHLLLSNVLLDQKSLNETSTRINDESILDFEQALAGQASVVTGRSVWDVLLKDVWMIDCLDGLENCHKVLQNLEMSFSEIEMKGYRENHQVELSALHHLGYSSEDVHWSGTRCNFKTLQHYGWI